MIKALLVPLVLAAAADIVQQQPRDAARPVVAGSVRVSGMVVTDGASPQPVRRAIVTIAGSPLTVSRSTITDDDGGFTFDALPPGRFTITAARKAYLTSAFGSAYHGDPGTPVSLGEAAHVTGIRITLRKGAVLTGVITDATGAPVPLTGITAFKVSESSYESAGADMTDDRGVYRIYGLPPGEYIVVAVPRVTGTGDMAIRPEREVDALLRALERRGAGSTTAAQPGEIGAAPAPAQAPRTYGFAPFYYPGTAVAIEASKITVAAGEERSGLDFTLNVASTAKIAGVVTAGDGQPARDVQVSIVSSGPPLPLIAGMGPSSAMRTGPDGSFQFSSVTPGTYRVLARRFPAPSPPPGTFTANPVTGRGAPAEWAMSDVTVNGEDIEGLALTLQPGLRMTGRIVFEGTSEVPADLAAIRVALSPMSTAGRGSSIVPIAAKKDGSIEITNLLPGAYAVSLALPPAVEALWWARSAMSGGRDLLDVPLELSTGAVPEIVFTLSDRRPSLSGSVEDESGRPTARAAIVMFSADRTHWRRDSRRVFVVRPDTQTRYEINDVPPGVYLIAAVENAQPDVRQPAFLERLAVGATRIVIAEGEQKTLDVRVSSTR